MIKLKFYTVKIVVVIQNTYVFEFLFQPLSIIFISIDSEVYILDQFHEC